MHIKRKISKWRRNLNDHQVIILQKNIAAKLEKPTVLLFTSMEERDEQSFIAAKLAMTFAQKNKKVLFYNAKTKTVSLDCLGPRNLLRVADLEDNRLITESFISNLDILSVPNYESPFSVFDQNIEQWKRRFHLVIVDAPPLIKDSLTQSMLYMSDDVVLVAKEGKTKRRDTADTVNYIVRSEKRLLGVIYQS